MGMGYFEEGAGDRKVKDEQQQQQQMHIPKGYLAVLVGEQRRRFVIPVMYVNHPLFMKLLKESEEEYGFHHNGPIIIPCRVHQFLTVQCMIHRDNPSLHHHHSHLRPAVWCFRD